MTPATPTAFACATASCVAAGVVLRLTLLPPRVPLLLGEVQLPILLQRCRRFLECLLHLLQLPC
jgi:hypothetical protein